MSAFSGTFSCQDSARGRISLWLSQDRKEKYFPISPNLASFAPLRLAPWNILSTEALSFHSRHYLTGRAPWNTDSTKIELFARSAIPQGSPCGVLISTQAEYDPPGVTPPRGIPPRQNIYRFRREVIPQGESSFMPCLRRILNPDPKI